jgi:cytochrome P450
VTTHILPPHPPGHPILKNFGDFGKNPLQFITRTVEEYGPVVRLELNPLFETYLVSEPEAITYILKHSTGEFVKGYARIPIMGVLFGQGLLISEGELWRRQRKLIQPLFHHDRIREYNDVMINMAEEVTAKWLPGATIDFHEEMMSLTMRIISKTMFNIDLAASAKNDEIGQSISEVLRLFNAQITSITTRLLQLLPVPVPNFRLRKIRAISKRVDKMFFELFNERAKDSHHWDLTSVLLAARDEEGNGMSRQQLRDEIMTLFLAGHETTSNWLTWTWYLLSQNRPVWEKLRNELVGHFGQRGPRPSDSMELPYARNVLQESLRLYPPVWWMSRKSNRDVEINGYRIPAGSQIAMSQWVMHRSAKYFEDPLRFEPERWERQPKPADGIYFPFGAGARVCIGNQFAMMEAVLILAVIARRFTPQLAAGHEVVPQPSVTLRPKYGLKVVLGLSVTAQS